MSYKRAHVPASLQSDYARLDPLWRQPSWVGFKGKIMATPKWAGCPGKWKQGLRTAPNLGVDFMQSGVASELPNSVYR